VSQTTGPVDTEALPWALLGIRSAVKEDSKCTTPEMVYGSPGLDPGILDSGGYKSHTHTHTHINCNGVI
jgi:hypothetical protein